MVYKDALVSKLDEPRATAKPVPPPGLSSQPSPILQEMANRVGGVFGSSPRNTGVSGYSAQPGGTQPPPVEAPSPFQFNQKNVMDILGKYEHTPAGLQKAFAENQGLAGASQIGGSKGDKILDPSTGRWIDVIQAAGAGGLGWQWLDELPGQGGAAPRMGGGMAPGGLGLGDLLSGDPSARIQQALGAFTQRSPNLDALLAQLQGR